MFDDPKKELNRLDQELRAESYEEQLEKLQSQEIPSLDDLLEDEDGDWLPEDFLQVEAGNPGSRPGANVRDYRRTVYADEPVKSDQDAVFVEKQNKGKQKDKQKDTQKGVGCLPFVIFLELAGIAGMLWWWYRWMR